MFGIDFCDVEMKSRYYLNFLEDILTICSYSGSYRIKKQKKIRKRRRVSLARGQKKFIKMLTSYTSSEEENIPCLREFAQNIGNNSVIP